MPTYDLGTATVSARVAQLLKSSYEREDITIVEPAALTEAEILARMRTEIRDRLARRVMNEKQRQREEAAQADDAAIDDEVSVE